MNSAHPLISKSSRFGDTAPSVSLTLNPVVAVIPPNISTPPTDPNSYLDTSLTPAQQAQIQSMVANALPTTIFTQYIVYGDEPPDSILTIDLSQYIDPTDYSNLQYNLTYMPRANLESYLTQNIQPIVDPQYYMIVKKAFINLFNTVNLAYVNKNSLTPYAWEAKKTESLYLSTAPPTQVETLDQYLSPTPPTLTAAQQQQISQIEASYAALPPIANTELETRRQAAVMGLIQLGEYDQAQSIIDTYTNLDAQTAAVLQDSNALAQVDLSQYENQSTVSTVAVSPTA